MYQVNQANQANQAYPPSSGRGRSGFSGVLGVVFRWGVCVCVCVTHCNAEGNARTDAHLPVGRDIPFVYVPSVRRECEGQQMKCCCPVARVSAQTFYHQPPANSQDFSPVELRESFSRSHLCTAIKNKPYSLENIWYLI